MRQFVVHTVVEHRVEDPAAKDLVVDPAEGIVGPTTIRCCQSLCIYISLCFVRIFV